MNLAKGVGGNIDKSQVLSAVEKYEKYHASYGGQEEERKANYVDMVNKFYDLATSFYEYGWGQSFHFAPRWKGESVREGIKRHEHFIALQLCLKPGQKVLDVGCGIGGPLREISRFSSTSITGLNNNEYQITRAKELNRNTGVDKTCNFVKADFMKMPFPDNNFDAVYAIEATCHAPDVYACYKEIFRVLKPGQLFAAYEWCMTEAFDPNNEEHQKIKEEIEVGDGLPDIRLTTKCVEALKQAGFEVIWEKDLAVNSPVPWYFHLDASHFSLSTFPLTSIGRFFTRSLIRALEFVRLAPRGSLKVQEILQRAADGLLEGGNFGFHVFASYSKFLVRGAGSCHNEFGIRYEKYHVCHGGQEEERKANYTDMVNKYYDLSTSFYEFGWGQSFHFAHRWKGESLQESIKRHEHFLALQLGLKPGQKVLDVGCGIGGPLREISRFSSTSVTGLNNNEYQITRREALNRIAGVDKTCNFVKADFMKMPFQDNSFDAVYAIEATCHAPDAYGCYKEIFRVLKPGQYFAAYEWCMTDAFDPNNEEHQRIKAEIEIGDGLPDIRLTTKCAEALKQAGFELIWEKDLAIESPVPWYFPLDTSRFSLTSFRLTAVGRFFTRSLVKGLEYVGFAPKGSLRVQEFLEKAADGLVEGGKKEIFTPMYFFLARKPESSDY
ncbi:Cycloartenol-C-24-methyltransferase [Glycine max]|nr:Cycloartenol-C-24-methyltransferase [Glycine max]